MSLFGEETFKVDKYDVRALMPSIPNPDTMPPKKLTPEDEELEVRCSPLSLISTA